MIKSGAVLALATAVIAAAAACSSVQPTAAPDGVQGVSVGLNATDLRSVLVPIAGQPATRSVQGPMTVKQAAELGGLVAAQGVTFAPKSCETYLADALGKPLNQLDGYVQYGTRVHEDHNDNFSQLALNIPTGANQALVDRVKAALAPCARGTVTFAGQTPVTGNVTYKARTGPALPGTVGYSVTGTTTFNVTAGSAEAELVRRFEMPPGASMSLDVAQSCVANVNVTGQGNTLLIVNESDPALADSLTTQMYNNLNRTSSPSPSPTTSPTSTPTSSPSVPTSPSPSTSAAPSSSSFAGVR
ncbi:hypothetical protein F4553_002401 [Allocatelliglobosispora scoriae]|uniref:PknH-like extracellular domain-containing protein n=1 Tax=Allocatelliglobosispora scoriae TaxID=643052 RepID=A0A841BQJ5_9ACTN|nr:hypothetical protein [Allocatelliglobosispora scoriae]MBB5869022.1 hypothetical protein [Allocatelliglobosispora scoriae]